MGSILLASVKIWLLTSRQFFLAWFVFVKITKEIDADRLFPSFICESEEGERST